MDGYAHHPGLAGFVVPGHGQTDGQTDTDVPDPAPVPPASVAARPLSGVEVAILKRRARVTPTDPASLGAWRRQNAERLASGQ